MKEILKGGPGMRASKFSEQQIAAAMRQAEGGTPVVEVCRKLGITDMGVAEL
jgi:putative transposase